MTAMDPKILAAVFASIAALTMSGTGSMEELQNFGSQDFLQDMQLPSGIGDIIGNIGENPAPENRARIDVTFKSVETVLEATGKGLLVENYTNLESESRGFDSANPLEFKDYSGKISISNETVIGGKASGFLSESLNYTHSMNLDLSTDATRIEIKEADRSKINLNNVDINFESESGTEISAENAPLKINSFSGNISIYPDEKRMTIIGLFDRVEAGTTSFSG